MASVNMPKFDFGDGYYYQPTHGLWRKHKKTEDQIFTEEELFAITRWCDFVKGARGGAQKAENKAVE